MMELNDVDDITLMSVHVRQNFLFESTELLE